MFILSLVQPNTPENSSVDMELVFAELFGSSRPAIPDDPEDFQFFKENLYGVFSLARSVGVKIAISDIEKSKNYVIDDINQFDIHLEILKELEASQSKDLPVTGNTWKIADAPDQQISNINPNSIIQNADANLNFSPEIKLSDALPSSEFNQRGKISNNVGVMDRLGRNGEAFPALNEDGTFSHEMIQIFDDLCLTEATDADLLNFLKGGLDLMKDTARGAVDVVKGANNLRKEYKQEKEEKERKAEEKERKAEEKQEKKEAKEKEGVKEQAKAGLQKAEAELENVETKQVAKDIVAGNEDTPAIKDKNSAMSQATQAINTAIDVGVSASSTVKEKKAVATEISNNVEKLEKKEKPEKEKEPKKSNKE